LYASLQTLVQRVKNRGYGYKDAAEMSRHYNDFEKIKDVFVKEAGVEEILVSTEGKTSQDVANEILEHLNL